MRYTDEDKAYFASQQTTVIPEHLQQLARELTNWREETTRPMPSIRVPPMQTQETEGTIRVTPAMWSYFFQQQTTQPNPGNLPRPHRLVPVSPPTTSQVKPPTPTREATIAIPSYSSHIDVRLFLTTLPRSVRAIFLLIDGTRSIAAIHKLLPLKSEEVITHILSFYEQRGVLQIKHITKQRE